METLKSLAAGFGFTAFLIGFIWLCQVAFEDRADGPSGRCQHVWQLRREIVGLHPNNIEEIERRNHVMGAAAICDKAPDTVDP
jgi:hypothetical protein